MDSTGVKNDRYKNTEKKKKKTIKIMFTIRKLKVDWRHKNAMSLRDRPLSCFIFIYSRFMMYLKKKIFQLLL